jgi:hypothetical protein
MTPRDRVVVEILAPAPLGTALFILWNLGEFTPQGFAPGAWALYVFVWAFYVLCGYAFAIVPSCVYALLVEWSLRRRWWQRLGSLGFIGFSTGLGALAGIAIWRASEAHVIGIGATVGLLLGILLAGAAGLAPIRLGVNSAVWPGTGGPGESSLGL